MYIASLLVHIECKDMGCKTFLPHLVPLKRFTKVQGGQSIPKPGETTSVHSALSKQAIWSHPFTSSSQVGPVKA